MTTQTGPRLTLTGTCEGCAHLRTSSVVLTCSHPQIRKGLTGFAIIATKASHEAWDMRGNMRHDCPELPAARLALARSICNHCGADIAPDYLGLCAKPTCEKCANERTGDTTDGPLCADCGDPLADPSTADECSAAHGGEEQPK